MRGGKFDGRGGGVGVALGVLGRVGVFVPVEGESPLLEPVGVLLEPVGLLVEPVGVLLVPVGLLLEPVGVLLEPVGVGTDAILLGTRAGVGLTGELGIFAKGEGLIVIVWLGLTGETGRVGGGRTGTGEGGGNVGKVDREGGKTGVGSGDGSGVVGGGGTSEVGGACAVRLVGLVVGAAACCLALGLFGNLSTAVVTPTAKSTAAAVGVQVGRPFFPRRGGLRLGNATPSAAYSSRAVAKSNSCITLRSTTGPDSSVASRPRKSSWVSKPLGCR